MRVLFLTNIPSPYRIDFFNELGKKCELTVLFERKSASDREGNWLKNEAKNFTPIFLPSIKFGKDTGLSLLIFKYLSNKYNHVVIGGYSTPTAILAIIFLKLKKIPFFINADGGFINKTESKIIYSIKKILISSATYYLSSGRKTNEYLIYYGSRKESIYNYNFTSLFQSDIVSAPLKTSDKEKLKSQLGLKGKVVISVGSFIERKNFVKLISAWSKIDNNTDNTLLIIGSGPLKYEYSNLIITLGLNNIILKNFMEKDELTNYYMAADVFAFPTLYDIWGLVINEAMAAGLPIISTNKCIAAIELVENNKQGYLISVDDEAVLSEKIKLLLNNNELRNEMAINSINRIKEYTIENMATRHIDIFNKI